MFQQPELIIHKEIRDLLETDTDCTPIESIFLHRKYRRDDMEEKINCPACNYKNNGTLEGQIGCPYCQGDGFLWDEEFINGWMFHRDLRKAKTSFQSPEEVGWDMDKEVRFLTLPPIYIYEGDLIYDVKLRPDKKVHVPLIKYHKYECYYASHMASDQTNSEFNIAGLRL